MAWHTPESARGWWSDAFSIDDDNLIELLEVAKSAVLAFAPALTDPAVVPDSYRMAQVMQAKSIWRAQEGTSESAIGPDGYSLPVYPLDKNIRQILRPRTVIPGMF